MGSYIPKIQRQGQQPSGMDLFMQQFLQGYQIGQQRLAQQREQEQWTMQREQMAQQAELHKLNLKKLTSEMQLEDAMRSLKFAGALQGQPGGSMQAPSPQIFSPAGLAPPPGEGSAPMALQDAGPARSIPMPHPEFKYDFSQFGGPAGSVRPQTAEQVREQNIADMIRKQIFETNEQVRAAGMKKRAEVEAERSPQEVNIPGMGPMSLPGNLAPTAVSGAFSRLNAKDANQSRIDAAGITAGASRENAAATREAAKTSQAGTREDKMLDDFARDTKEFVSMDDAYAKIKAAATGESGASDLSLVYGYMKLLDPNSVVREGEVANASNTAGVPDRIITAYNKALRGERLAPAQRNAFIAESKKVYDAVKPRLKQVERRYQDRARRVGADPGLFSFQSNAGAPAPTGPTATDPKTGKKVQWNGSVWVPLQ